MTANERTTTEPQKRTIECVCGVTLDMRTQGLYCPPCRARNRNEQERSKAEAWARYDRRLREDRRSDAPNTDMESLLDSLDRLVRALETGRFASAQPRPTTSRIRPTRQTAPQRGTGGLSLNDLETE